MAARAVEWEEENEERGERGYRGGRDDTPHNRGAPHDGVYRVLLSAGTGERSRLATRSFTSGGVSGRCLIEDAIRRQAGISANRNIRKHRAACPAASSLLRNCLSRLRTRTRPRRACLEARTTGGARASFDPRHGKDPTGRRLVLREPDRYAAGRRIREPGLPRPCERYGPRPLPAAPVPACPVGPFSCSPVAIVTPTGIGLRPPGCSRRDLHQKGLPAPRG